MSTKPGVTTRSVGVDRPGGRLVDVVLAGSGDRHHPPVADGHVRPAGRRPRAVDNRAALDQKIEHVDLRAIDLRGGDVPVAVTPRVVISQVRRIWRMVFGRVNASMPSGPSSSP